MYVQYMYVHVTVLYVMYIHRYLFTRSLLQELSALSRALSHDGFSSYCLYRVSSFLSPCPIRKYPTTIPIPNSPFPQSPCPISPVWCGENLHCNVHDESSTVEVCAAKKAEVTRIFFFFFYKESGIEGGLGELDTH